MPPRRSSGDSTVDASKLTFPLQIVILIISTVLASAAGGWVSRSDIRSLAEEQIRMTRAISAIEAKLPNKEALDGRLQGMDERQRELAERVRTLEVYNQDLREKMAAKGVLN